MPSCLKVEKEGTLLFVTLNWLPNGTKKTTKSFPSEYSIPSPTAEVEKLIPNRANLLRLNHRLRLPPWINERKSLLMRIQKKRKGALGDGQEVSEVRQALEKEYNIHNKGQEFELIKEMEKENPQKKMPRDQFYLQ